MPNPASSVEGKLGAVAGRGLPHDPLEHAIEMRQGLKAHFIRDLAHAEVGVQKQVSRLFDSHAREVVSEIDSGHLLEHFAKIERAGVYGLGDLSERDVLLLMFA